jgi:hypothetical protein
MRSDIIADPPVPNHHTLQEKSRLTSFFLERVMGIEPTSSAWKAEVLPLNYTRKLCITFRPAIIYTAHQAVAGF